MIPGLVERINARRAKTQSGQTALPPGFGDRDED